MACGGVVASGRLRWRVLKRGKSLSDQQTVSQRVRLRRSLLQVASLLMLTLISIMLLSLFSVWSLDRAYARTTAENRQLVAALDGSRRAQVAFKRQVQAWKNLLLRGAAPADNVKYRSEFLVEADLVETSLRELASQLAGLKLDKPSRTVSALGDEHQALLRRYQQALGAHGDRVWDGSAIDRTVRGIDRSLNDSIDRVANQLLEETGARADRLERDLRERYATLRQLQWGATALAAGLMALLLGRVLRDRSIAG